jgi:prolyl oligopeptidase
LYIQKGLDGTPEVFIDPNTLSADGSTSLAGTSISNDNKYLAYSISKSGSDINQIYVMEIETKKQLPDIIDWVKFSGQAGISLLLRNIPKPVGENELTARNEYQKSIITSLARSSQKIL